MATISADGKRGTILTVPMTYRKGTYYTVPLRYVASIGRHSFPFTPILNQGRASGFWS